MFWYQIGGTYYKLSAYRIAYVGYMSPAHPVPTTPAKRSSPHYYLTGVTRSPRAARKVVGGIFSGQCWSFSHLVSIAATDVAPTRVTDVALTGVIVVESSALMTRSVALPVRSGEVLCRRQSQMAR